MFFITILLENSQLSPLNCYKVFLDNFYEIFQFENIQININFNSLFLLHHFPRNQKEQNTITQKTLSPKIIINWSKRIDTNPRIIGLGIGSLLALPCKTEISQENQSMCIILTEISEITIWVRFLSYQNYLSLLLREKLFVASINILIKFIYCKQKLPLSVHFNPHTKSKNNN